MTQKPTRLFDFVVGSNVWSKTARVSAMTAMAAAISLSSATSANAQATEKRCVETLTGPNAAMIDACQKVFDLFRFITPQVGVALAGGSPVLGESGAIGGGGNVSLVVRATAIDGFIPDRDANITTSGQAVSSNLGAKRAPIPMASADIAAGIYRGKPVGLTNVGGIDLLLGLTYVPDVNEDAFTLKTSGSGFAGSYGVRVGITQESAAVPGISVTYRQRRLPSTNIQFTPEDDTLRVKSASIAARSFRVVAGKHYRFLGVSGGYGRDQIIAKSLFDASIHSGAINLNAGLPPAEDKFTRSNAFLNLSIGYAKAQLVGEVGWSGAGKNTETLNTFENEKANQKFRYYSLGLSIRP